MKRLLVALTAALVITSTAAGASLAFSSPVAATEPTTIESCTTINASGEYVLANNITGAQDGCIQITADNVTLDGDGHVLDGEGENYERAIVATDVENVTVHNVSITEWAGEGILFESVTGGEVRESSFEVVDRGAVVSDSSNVTVVDNHIFDVNIVGVELERTNNSHITANLFEEKYIYAGIELSHSHNNLIDQNTVRDIGGNVLNAKESNRNVIVNNTATDTYGGVIMRDSDGNRISENTLSDTDTAVSVRGAKNVISNNTVIGGFTGISVGGSEDTVVKNDVSHTIDFAITVDGTNQTITDNHIRGGGEGISGSGGGVRVEGANQTIANNNITGAVNSVKVQFSNGTIEIVDNNLESFQRGVWVADKERAVCGQKESTNASFVEVHGNAIADDGYHFYGVLNEANGTVNATGNYWGATDGPSSPEDQTVTDPKTGRQANGSGTTVSDGVRFDPFLTTDPTTDDAQSEA
ncbi:right-handed parallel beta-helix repeat-containing protein [Haladaptatus sp. CMSO5]|uniref:right-handed parallel beta-helix repeat-containing protein n=1 Tax=Haladaptatus sp. CMSO5 TaxID=3120514 RepID=UPI002FCE2EED